MFVTLMGQGAWEQVSDLAPTQISSECERLPVPISRRTGQLDWAATLGRHSEASRDRLQFY